MYCDCPSCRQEKQELNSKGEQTYEPIEYVSTREYKNWTKILLEFYVKHRFLTERQKKVLKDLGLTLEDFEGKVDEYLESNNPFD